jgi:hypothetical protein
MASPPTAGSEDPVPWLAWLLVVAGAVVAVGSALPWITLRGSGAAAATVFIQSKGGGLGGLDHEGAVAVVLGAGAVWLGGARRLGRALRASVWGGLLAGLGSLALVAWSWSDGSSLADPFGGPAAGVVQGPGVGLWVTAAGAVVLVVGSAVALAQGAGRPTPDQSSASTSSTDSAIEARASSTEENRAVTS